MLKGVGGLLRDVWWRREFLRTHPHLMGPDGAAQAASWPLGSARMILSCLCLVAGFAVWDVMAVDLMLAMLLAG